MRSKLNSFYPALLAFFLFIGIWQIVSQNQLVASYLLPSPLEIFKTFVEMKEDFLKAFFSTLLQTLFGLTLSILVGGSIAIVFSLNDFLRRALLPFCVFFQTVPIIAIAPLMVIWFGFGSATVRASAFIVSIFPILANTLVGLNSASPELKELFALYRASRWQILFKLQVPSSLGYFLSGVRIASGLAVIGAIVGEFVGGGGLGNLIDSARTQQRADIVFAAVVLSSLLGLLLITLTQVISALLLKRPYYQKEVLR